MAFSLTRPPSPSREPEGISTHDYGEDYLSSALHAAFSTFLSTSSVHPHHQHDMIKEKERVGIDITVDSDCLSLRGTGVDVEPALLNGNIVLHLREPTSIKEITLQFRGKARLPAPTSVDTLPLGTFPSQWYTLCNHEWSFLEGEKRHSHTLKAGIHQFPFQIQLGGSLPSSISNGHGAAHVSYKLRAVAVRPGLAHNMQAAMPITIVRTFAPESLEYQQSLEIESTWPEKLMYSIMIPHKAWAAGDKLTAIVKFSPLAKGVRVLTVSTTINETTKWHCRAGLQEHTRAVVTSIHEIPNGPSERLDGFRPPPIPTLPELYFSHADRVQSSGSLTQDLFLRQVLSRDSSSSSSHDSPPVPVTPLPSSDPPASLAELEASTTTAEEEEPPRSQDDIVAHLSLFIPKFITPSHLLDPVVISHRIRWSILMSNLDGHTSELRCSLPLHILDVRLLDEARANSAATRRLLLDSPEAPVDEEQDAELPSYSAHVRDRVANMYLPDSATTRVLNPWVHSNLSPTFMPEHQSLSGAWTPGTVSSLMPHPVSSHLPHVPPSETGTPLDWVNSELLLSLSNTTLPVPRANTSPHSLPNPISQPDSALVSRRNSRAPSPELHLTMTPAPLSYASTMPETFVHDSHASRALPGVFSIQMKPHTTLPSPGWLSSRSNSHSNLMSLADAGHGRSVHGNRPVSTASVPVPVSQTSTPPVSGNTPESTLWHRAFTEVPDYDVASRGFIGGVTPLTSTRGLPSYEEAERGVDGDEDWLTIHRGRVA